MNQNAPSRWVKITNTVKFWFASLAIRICGIETLYWSAPLKWEAYMSKGEPMTADIVAQELLAKASFYLGKVEPSLDKEIDDFFKTLEA